MKTNGGQHSTTQESLPLSSLNYESKSRYYVQKDYQRSLSKQMTEQSISIVDASERRKAIKVMQMKA